MGKVLCLQPLSPGREQQLACKCAPQLMMKSTGLDLQRNDTERPFPSMFINNNPFHSLKKSLLYLLSRYLWTM